MNVIFPWSDFVDIIPCTYMKYQNKVSATLIHFNSQFWLTEILNIHIAEGFHCYDFYQPLIENTFDGQEHNE